MDTVLYLHAKARSIPEEVDYLLFQIGNAYYDIRNPVCLEPLNNPLKKRLSPTLTRPLGKSDVMGLSRTPSPPDRTTAVLGRFESLANALIEQRRLTDPGISVPS